MKEEEVQSSYQFISFLLRYPTEEYVHAVDEVSLFIDEVEEASIRQPLATFHSQAKMQSYDQWIEHYIEIFDFGKSSNLYMTYLKLGEQKERGLELLKLKKFYQAAGFEVTDKELPDYLPLMLEFCGQVNKTVRLELLTKYIAAIVETKNKLAEFNSFYHFVLEALLGIIRFEGVEIDEKALVKEEKPLSLEDVRIMNSMREQLIQNQLG